MLPTPSFHHLHLNSVDPDAAIDFYVQRFPSARRTTWAGAPALAARNDVLILFTRVREPPRLEPPTAFWHFGWHVTDSRTSLATFRSAPDVTLLPLYTSEGDASVLISSDTWQGTAGVLGLTRAQIAEAKAAGIRPQGGAGFAYMAGPDGALVEYAGDYAQERFNHIHMWQDDPYCAQLWYREHLNAAAMAGRETPGAMTGANCRVPRGPERTWPCLEREGMYRSPRAAVMFGDVALTWYPRQGDAPLTRPKGYLMDHIGLGVADLDAWISKLRAEDVAILAGPYPLGDTRALMIEGPSLEAIELVETHR